MRRLKVSEDQRAGSTEQRAKRRWKIGVRSDERGERTIFNEFSTGLAQYFGGTVRIDPLFDAHAPARAFGAGVTFEPGARTSCGGE